MKPVKVALCLPGGGAFGAMYQIGALAALEDGLNGANANAFDLYVATSSGATVAATLAGGRPVQRIYRAILDPADVYFPLERKHLVRMDFGEWRRAVGNAVRALRHGSASFLSRPASASPAALWEQLDRFYDSLPAGLFRLDEYEKLLESFFSRRGIPSSFEAMPKPLRVLAHDLDSGEAVFFGDPSFEHVPVSLACAATLALPPFFSPVKIDGRHYIDAGAAQVVMLDKILEHKPEVIVVVNPLVPVLADRVPTGHGEMGSVVDKGSMWVVNQATRIGVHSLLSERIRRIRHEGLAQVLWIEPEPTDAILFLHNPASFSSRRAMLEYAYRTTRERLVSWLDTQKAAFDLAGWQQRVSVYPPAPGG